ncbi:Flp pilus assembly protein CpaB [Oceanimonas smirnovii]|uniref:Flp pilus assembly protein CpaB n=1 Tax=Oceanimonas smirnovii TaxID=264574 RepID=UPI003FCF206C
MNSRLMLGLAGLLLTGAIVAGYKGVQLSNQLDQQAPPAPAQVTPPPAAVPQAGPAPAVAEQISSRQSEEPRTAVVVLARPLQPFEEITAAHLSTEQLKIAPPGTFRDTQALLGRYVWQYLPAGTVLSTAAFGAGGPLARLIGENERALAVAIDDVSGGGGFIQPGDYVDVLLYLRKNDTNTDQTAQVVVPALRVLSVGDALSVGEDGQPVQYRDEDAQPASRQRAAQTAVLAVPATLTSRLMLATQAGTLRLAVRSASEARLADYFKNGLSATALQEIERQLFQFEQLALRQSSPAARSGPARHSVGVPVYRGPDVSRQTP